MLTGNQLKLFQFFDIPFSNNGFDRLNLTTLKNFD